MNAVRRNRVRLLLRDLAAGCAFGSMAISGVLPVYAIAVFGGAFALALLNKRILSNRGTTTAIILLLAGLALYGQVAFANLDLVLAACSFAGFISAQRMLAPANPQTDAQVHLTSLLMIAGGAALSADLLFALALMFFVVAATYSLGLGVLEEALPEGADFSLRPIAWRLGLGATAALIGAAVFFLVFPRLSWNLATRRPSGSVIAPTAGTAETIAMRGNGTIKTNPRVVLRAEISPDPRRETLNAYWLGTSFDTFTGDEWIGGGTVMQPSNGVRLGRRSSQELHQKIEILPAYGSQVLVALETPTLIANATGHSPSGSARIPLVEIDGKEVRFGERAVSYTYHAYTPRDPNTVTTREEDPDRYLRLPASLDSRVIELANQVAGLDRDPLAVATRMQAYLQTNYRYTLELSDAEDPLVDFLFVRKEGHCEHFAAALAVMLRAVGIPSRVASGFFGGERVNNYYVVRAGDAHAWTHVLVPGRGFVNVDATPEENRPGAPNSTLAWLTGLYERLEDYWRRAVVEYDIFQQAQLARDLVRPPQNREEGGTRPSGGTSRYLAALVAALIAYIVWRIPRMKRGRAAKDEATGLLEDVEAVLARHRIEPTEGEGIEEVAERLHTAAHPLAPAVRKVTRRYLEARFGRKPLEPGERQHLAKTMARASEAARLAALSTPSSQRPVQSSTSR